MSVWPHSSSEAIGIGVKVESPHKYRLAGRYRLWLVVDVVEGVSGKAAGEVAYRHLCVGQIGL